jgi:hypothetical protein
LYAFLISLCVLYVTPMPSSLISSSVKSTNYGGVIIQFSTASCHFISLWSKYSKYIYHDW